jgi:hypothetical protein
MYGSARKVLTKLTTVDLWINRKAFRRELAPAGRGVSVMNLRKQLDDRLATPDEVHLALAEEKRQRAARTERQLISTCLGDMIRSVFGSKSVNEQGGAIGTETATQIEREK